MTDKEPKRKTENKLRKHFYGQAELNDTISYISDTPSPPPYKVDKFDCLSQQG